MKNFTNETNRKNNQENAFNWEKAHKTATSCEHFKEDVEEECIADESVSCYNCRYRRWTEKSYECCKSKGKK